MANALISGFDHAVIAVRDLDLAVAAYRDLGFECSFGGRHAGRGTHNAIVAFGQGYIELIGVHDEAMARACGGNVLDLVRYLGDRGDGPLGFAFATSDLGALRIRWTSQDQATPMPEVVPMERTRPDGIRLTWRLLIPGGSAWRKPWPFFIRWDDTPGRQRMEAERLTSHPNGASRVAGISVVVRSLAEVLFLYRDVMGLTIVEEPAYDVEVGAERVRLEINGFQVDLLEPAGSGPARAALDQDGEGLFQIDLEVSDLPNAAVWTAAERLNSGTLLVPQRASCGTRLSLRAT